MAKQIFIIRQACTVKGNNPSLKDFGVHQAVELSKNIKFEINPGSIEIWSATMKSSKETAEIIAENLGFDVSKIIYRKKLNYTDIFEIEELVCLNEMINNSLSDAIIIIASAEHVKYFLEYLGFNDYYISFAEGVLIEGKNHMKISWK